MPERVLGESFKNDHQLLHSQFGFCGPAAGGAGSAALRLRRGKNRPKVALDGL